MNTPPPSLPVVAVELRVIEPPLMVSPRPYCVGDAAPLEAGLVGRNVTPVNRGGVAVAAACVKRPPPGRPVAVLFAMEPFVTVREPVL